MVIIVRAVFHKNNKNYPQVFWHECLMLCYDIIDISEGIYVNETSASKECDVCHYCHFVNYSFQFLTKTLAILLF